MTVTALKGKVIPALGYSKGRKDNVDLLVIHTAEGSRTNDSLGHFFAHDQPDASSNAGIDDNGYALFVAYGNTPWTNPPINTRSETVELCAFKGWSRTEWLKHRGMLETLAHWIAWRCAVRGIPIRLLTPKQILAGAKGIADHHRVNQAYHKSDHTDVGDHFPWDVVIARAQSIALPPAPKQPKTSKTSKGDRILGLYNPSCTGQDVANWQNVLRVCGNDITIDGLYDQETSDLTTKFKANRGISEAGVGERCWAEGRKIVHG